MRFPPLGGSVQRQRCKPIQRPPRVSKQHWRSHDTASGDLSGYLSRAENGGLTACPSVRFSDSGFRPPAPRPFYLPLGTIIVPLPACVEHELLSPHTKAPRAVLECCAG